MSRQFTRIFQFSLVVLGITAVLVFTAHAAPVTQEIPTARPRFNLEEIPFQAAESDQTVPGESALSVTAPDILLSWSKVAFQSLRNGNWDIYVGNDDGSGQTAVVASGASEIHPHLNRGNTKIVYASNSGGDHEIYVANVDGSGQIALTNNSTDDGNPTWSPDGSKIAFEAYRNGEADIYVMNANGTGQTRLTTSADFDGMPTWSPDGSKIAFVSRRTGGYRIYVMNADGSGQTQLSNQPYSLRPQWSPDGTQIAYDADNDADGWQDLWRMNADGTGQSLIHNPSGQTDAWASSWSPDGSRIVFTRISFIQYQGNWYWIEAYPDAWSSNQGIARLSSSGLDWDASWQTSDTIAPSSQVNALPAESPGPIPVSWSASDSGGSGIASYTIQVKIGDGSWQDWWTNVSAVYGNYPGVGGETYAFRVRARDRAFNYEAWPLSADASTKVESQPPTTWLNILPEYSRYNKDLTVSWGGTDPGNSGVKNYAVQYKIGVDGSWTDWKTITGQTTAVFKWGTAGNTYYFRVRGTDAAENVESWATGNGDGHVTFYRWASYGYVFDNTHTPIAGASSTTNPIADSIVPSNIQGSYFSYVLDYSTLYSATWSKAGYGAIPSTIFEPEPDGYHNVVLPPVDNVIANWDFETGAASPEWSSIGTLTQGVVTTTQNSGTYGFAVGASAALSIDNLTNSMLGSFVNPKVAFGQNGEVHLVWREQTNPVLRHSERLDDGTWSASVEIPLDGLKQFGVADMKVGLDGSLHIILAKELTQSYPTKTDLYYIRRDADKVWYLPEKIYHSDNPNGNSAGNVQLLVTDTGVLHFVWQEKIKIDTSTTCGYDIFYLQRLSNGTWQSPVNVSNSCEANYYDQLKIFEFQEMVHVLWLNDDDVYHRVRNANGSWTDPEYVYSLGQHTNMPAAFVDVYGVLHLLVSATFSDNVYYMNYEYGWSQSQLLPIENSARMVGDSDGNIHIAWRSSDTAEILYLKQTSDQVWLEPQVIFEGAIFYYLEIATDLSGKLHLICVGEYDGSEDILYSWKDSNDLWSPAINLSNTVEDSNFSSFTVDNAGNYHIIGTEYDGISPSEYIYYGPKPALVEGASSISQEITLAPSLASPTLSFFYQLGGVLPSGDSEFVVKLTGSMGEETIYSTKQSTPGWVHEWVDLSAWTDETITLSFELIQAANSPTAWAYLDEVSLGSTYNDVWVDIESVNAGIGETVPIVISYGNRGGTLAEDVEISLSLPGSLVFEGSSVASIDSSTPTWQVGDLPAKSEPQEIVVYVRVRQAAPSFTELTNSVSIVTSSAELETLNNSATGSLFTGKFIYLPSVFK